MGERLAQTFETNEQIKLIIAHHVRECKTITVNVLHDSVLHKTRPPGHFHNTLEKRRKTGIGLTC